MIGAISVRVRVPPHPDSKCIAHNYKQILYIDIYTCTMYSIIYSHIIPFTVHAVVCGDFPQQNESIALGLHNQ